MSITWPMAASQHDTNTETTRNNKANIKANKRTAEESAGSKSRPALFFSCRRPVRRWPLLLKVINLQEMQELL